MIRILHIVTDMRRGGLESMLMNYYRHIDRTKIQFDFLTHRDYHGDYDDEIESLGGKIYHISRLVPWSYSYKQELRSFFDSHTEYKLIHVHQDCLSGVICKIAKECGVHVRIAHSHNSSQDKNLKYLLKLFYKKWIPRYATHLLSCGRKAGDWMFDGVPFEILNNAINTTDYSYNPQKRVNIRSQLGLNDELVIGHIGRFSYPKNHPFLLGVFFELVKLEPKAVLLLVGGGQDMSKIQALADTLGITNNVRFLGVRNDVADLLQAMDVFVFPSRYEGFPVTMIEAQASGLPCIISDKVPVECAITDSVKIISLSTSPEIWAEEILAAKKDERKNNQDLVLKAGYDINENAIWLQNYYMEHWKANT